MPGAVTVKSYKADNTENLNSKGDSALPVIFDTPAEFAYEDATYKYYVSGPPAGNKSDAVWAIERQTLASLDEFLPCGDGSATFTAIDVADVAEGAGTPAHTYALGA